MNLAPCSECFGQGCTLCNHTGTVRADLRRETLSRDPAVIACEALDSLPRRRYYEMTEDVAAIAASSAAEKLRERPMFVALLTRHLRQGRRIEEVVDPNVVRRMCHERS